jgi:hypothetical protein
LAVAAATLAGTVACSTRPPADEIWLYYMDGPRDAKQFSACVEPNTKGDWKANNQVFALPTSLRTWNIRPDGGDTGKPVVAGTKPDAKGQAGPQVEVYTTTEFYLNTNCSGGAGSPVVTFWEKTGRRYKLSTADAVFDEKAWRAMLLNTLVPVLEKTLQGVTRDFSADQLDADLDGTWRKAETAMGAEFAEQLKAKVGGDYFCGPSYDRAAKTCPPVRVSITDINYQDKGLQDARAAVRKAEEDAKRALIEAQSQVAVARELAKLGDDPNYLRLRQLENELAIARERTRQAELCAKNPNCTVIVGDASAVVSK